MIDLSQFVDKQVRVTLRIRYQVIKQPAEENLNFKRPIFDTWAEAIMCVCNLRNYPKFYATTVDGVWMEVANV